MGSTTGSDLADTQPYRPLTRNEIIPIISAFYSFLCTRHPTIIKPLHISTPPSLGWPAEYISAWSKMGKSSEILDLLAHLPYIENHTRAPLFGETSMINYADELTLHRLKDFDWEKKKYLFEPLEQHLGEDAVSLTQGLNYGNWVILDFAAGSITEYSMLGSLTPEGEEEAGEQVWRLYPTTSIKDYFEKWMEKIGGVGKVEEETKKNHI